MIERFGMCLLCVLVCVLTQSGCFDAAPVYAAYQPRAEFDEEKTSPHHKTRSSSWWMPELYLTESQQPMAGPESEPSSEPVNTGEPTSSSDVQTREPMDDAAKLPEEEEEPSTEHLIGVINLNTATASELELLPRVGKALSARIIAYRERRAFTRPTQLRRVKGIGKATYARFAPHLVVEGETTLRRR